MESKKISGVKRGGIKRRKLAKAKERIWLAKAGSKAINRKYGGIVASNLWKRKKPGSSAKMAIENRKAKKAKRRGWLKAQQLCQRRRRKRGACGGMAAAAAWRLA